jgi:hypothetical protein
MSWPPFSGVMNPKPLLSFQVFRVPLMRESIGKQAKWSNPDCHTSTGYVIGIFFSNG